MNLSDLLGVASRQTTASLSLPFDHSSCTRLVDPQTKHIGPQIEFFLRLTEAAETLRAILKDNHLMRTAVNVEPENMQMDMLTSAMATVREDEEVRQPIEEKIGRVVRKR